MPTAEVISIGDELTSGQRLDTNCQWLSTRLGELGIRVMYHTTVADDLAANRRVFEQAIQRADVVVTSGGLGPTADDLTRDALAAVTGRELLLDEDSLDHIRQLFSRRGREMPERNTVQAMSPNGSRPIFNPHGTAPGIEMEIPKRTSNIEHPTSNVEGDVQSSTLFFCLPGVPAEMREMWPAVADTLRQQGLVQQIIRHRAIRCFGVGESDLEQMLPDLIRRGREPSVGITASGATLTLRITAAGPSEEACYAAMEPTVATIREIAGTLVFGKEEEELQHAVARLLAERKRTLAVVEWGTGGQIAHWLSELPEIEPHFAGAVVISDSQFAAKLLGIPHETLAADSATRRETAEALAAAGRQRLGGDYVLAVGPFPAADTLGDDDRIHFALGTPQGIKTHSPRYASHPSILKVRAAKQALDFVRLTLME